MKKFFAKRIGDKFILEDDEFAHFCVLRCKIGENVVVLEDDQDYLCKVDKILKKQAILSIVSAEKNTKNPNVNITVFQGLVKGEKLDLIVQKLTELGVSNLFTFESEFAIAKSNNNKIERLIKISQEACKQCGRSIPMTVNPSLKFDQMLEKLNGFDIILFANEKNKARNLDEIKTCKNVAIIIGSEGGFSDAEISKIYGCGALNFGLGERILRAETASIATSAIVAYILNA